MSREAREWYHRTRRGARSRCFNSSGLGISFCFVNVDGNGVLHYSSSSCSSPKSNRQGSLLSFLLPKSFALFVALVSSGCRRRRRRFAAAAPSPVQRQILLRLQQFFSFFPVHLVVSKTDLCSVLFCCSSCCSKRSGKEILFSTYEEKSKAYNNFLVNASLSLSLSLSGEKAAKRRMIRNNL
jgi:hypothetical protein